MKGTKMFIDIPKKLNFFFILKGSNSSLRFRKKELVSGIRSLFWIVYFIVKYENIFHSMNRRKF